MTEKKIGRMLILRIMAFELLLWTLQDAKCGDTQIKMQTIAPRELTEHNREIIVSHYSNLSTFFIIKETFSSATKGPLIKMRGETVSTILFVFMVKYLDRNTNFDESAWMVNSFGWLRQIAVHTQLTLTTSHDLFSWKRKKRNFMKSQNKNRGIQSK